MGRDLGGVEYDEDAALYPGAVFPEPEGEEEDVYHTEVLLTMSEETAWRIGNGKRWRLPGKSAG